MITGYGNVGDPFKEVHSLIKVIKIYSLSNCSITDYTFVLMPQRLGVAPGEVITVTSRRGAISLYARADEGTPEGAVFIPFCFYEAAANLLTNPVLDPFGKIPEFKYCAVNVARGGELTPLSTYGGGQARVQIEPA